MQSCAHLEARAREAVLSGTTPAGAAAGDAPLADAAPGEAALTEPALAEAEDPG